jgi:iron(III) transport system ATP-binding protein
MSITVENVAKTFGDVKALRPTNLTVREGEFISLVGPSGCGKTTLLRILAGLEIPDGGKISLGDRVVYSSEEGIEIPAESRGVGMVFQDFALWPHMTVFENVAFGLRARKDTARIKERVSWALERVQLSGYEDRYPKEMSGGQQQRVSFARAIVTEPKIILLDEPLSALDAVLRDGLRLMLRALTDELGLTAVYVTHDQHEAMAISDRIVVMKLGEMLQMGVPEEVYSKPSHLFVANFVGKSNFLPEGTPVNGLGEGRYMTRPEQLRLDKKSADDLEFTGTIETISYLGDRYEVHMDVQGNTWIAHFPRRLEPGETVKIYLSKEDIHTIKEGLE